MAKFCQQALHRHVRATKSCPKRTYELIEPTSSGQVRKGRTHRQRKVRVQAAPMSSICNPAVLPPPNGCAKQNIEAAYERGWVGVAPPQRVPNADRSACLKSLYVSGSARKSFHGHTVTSISSLAQTIAESSIEAVINFCQELPAATPTDSSKSENKSTRSCPLQKNLLRETGE